MNSASVEDLLPAELAALMHFYAEAGVMWLSEEQAIDRFAERAAPPVAATAPTHQRMVENGEAKGAIANRRVSPAPSMPIIAAPIVAVPDAEAVESARNLAAGAATAEALMAAVASFAGCNLRFSARHTVFAAGNLSARTVVVGGVPAAEDDREGRPFSGPAGRIFDRMMAGAGFDAEDILMLNLIPWRTPGDRAPTMREVEICTPFARRLIELVRPEAVLVLGNLPVRILSDETKAGIHGLRGKWFDLPTGSARSRAFATFHPEEMLATPACKRHAWQDLLRFKAELNSLAQAPASDM